MHIEDPVTIKLTFGRPATEDELGAAINAMLCAVPPGADGRVSLRMTFTGIPSALMASLETAFALGKAQLAVRANARRRGPA